MKTDTSEKALETLIMRHMTGVDGLSSDPVMVGESAPNPGGSGWFAGHAKAYDREFAVDVEQLFAFFCMHKGSLGNEQPCLMGFF